MKIAKDDYIKIKTRILDYHQMNKEKIDTDSKSQFKPAKMKPGELIGIYCRKTTNLISLFLRLKEKNNNK